jgi:DNA-binding IclR family transcriptional regulator
MCQVSESPSNGNDAEGQDRRTGSARRVLDLLLCFNKRSHTLSSRDLSAMTGIALPSVYRYVALLRETGLLVGDERGNYHVSMRVATLAGAAEAADSLIDIADPVMRRLREVTGETVLLARLVGQVAVCVHRIECSHLVRLTIAPGEPIRLKYGASSRVLLATMPPAEQRIVLERRAAEDPVAAAQLEQSVALAKKRGWATSEEDPETGVWAASAAVLDPAGRTIAALSVPAPIDRAPKEVREKRLSLVRGAAEEITRLIAAHPPA